MRTLCLACLMALPVVSAVSRGAEPASAPATPAASGSGAEIALAAVALPPPETDSKFSLERALHERRSVRASAETPLTLREIGQLCWAAQGVTDEKGHRTAPSAMATYPLDLYVLAGAAKDLASGCYRYDPARHLLAPMAAAGRPAEFEERAVRQGWTAKAPVMFVISGTAARMTKMRDRGAQFMWVEAGLAAQGLLLQATALGLGSTYVGGFDPEQAHAVLGLPEGEVVLGVFPVGYRP